MRLFGLEEPQIPPGLEFVWNWFFELAAGRAHNGFAWQPITWADMAAWAAISGIRLAPWLAACFRAMDREWLKIQAEGQQKKKNRS